MLENKMNDKYDVLTPNGWSNFCGIKRKISSDLIEILYTKDSENKSIVCTKEHLFQINDNDFIVASKLNVGDILFGNIEICGISEVPDEDYVYDLVNVELESRYYTNDLVSHNCTFLGSAGTLISSMALKSMAFSRPIRKLMEGMEIYEEPIDQHFYVCTVDSSRGIGLDYSAFVIIDTSTSPFKIVAKFKSNTISPLLFPNIIVQAAKYYNEAYLLIENNDVGGQVADFIFHELEYDLMFHGEEERGRVHISQHRTKQLGIKTTKRVKRQGCIAVKDLIENQKLLVQDFNIIEELSTFILRRDGSYGAEEGSNDDLVMCLVLFSWLTAQPYFKDLTNFDIRKKLFEERMRMIDEEILPLPTTSDDLLENTKYSKENGIIWEVVDQTDKNWFS